MKNREFETLTEVTFSNGKVRVWITSPSLGDAARADHKVLHVLIGLLAREHWPNFHDVALAIEAGIPDVSAIAITDDTGCGLTLYPDWK